MTFFIICFSSILTMSVPDIFYTRNVLCTKTKLDIHVFILSFYILFIRVGGFIRKMIIIVPENLHSFLVLYDVRALFLLLSLAFMFGLLFLFCIFPLISLDFGNICLLLLYILSTFLFPTLYHHAST